MKILIFTIIIFTTIHTAQAQVRTGKGIFQQGNIARLEASLLEQNRIITNQQKIINNLTSIGVETNILYEDGDIFEDRGNSETENFLKWVVGITNDGHLEYREFEGFSCPDTEVLGGIGFDLKPICRSLPDCPAGKKYFNGCSVDLPPAPHGTERLTSEWQGACVAGAWITIGFQCVR